MKYLNLHRIKFIIHKKLWRIDANKKSKTCNGKGQTQGVTQASSQGTRNITKLLEPNDVYNCVLLEVLEFEFWIFDINGGNKSEKLEMETITIMTI